jgi:DNA repair protein RadA/Sms
LAAKIGLSGEVRKVTQGEARLKEAIKLGFNRVICSGLENLNKNFIHSIAHIKQLKGLI